MRKTMQGKEEMVSIISLYCILLCKVIFVFSLIFEENKMLLKCVCARVRMHVCMYGISAKTVNFFLTVSYHLYTECVFSFQKSWLLYQILHIQ